MKIYKPIFLMLLLTLLRPGGVNGDALRPVAVGEKTSLFYEGARPGSLDELPRSSWYFRTVVWVELPNGQVQAFKFLKDDESPEVLEHEAGMMQELWDKGMDAPRPVRSGKDSYVFTYKGKLPNAPKEAKIHPSRRYISYIVSKDYFVYPGDIKDKEQARRCAINSISQYAKLLKAGYIHTSLSPLTHTGRTLRKFYWNVEPIGKIEGPGDTNIFYASNIRLYGLADFAHVRRIDNIDYLYYIIGEGLFEWATTLTYHFRNNSIPQEEIASILKEGFMEYLNIIGAEYEPSNADMGYLKEFIKLLNEEPYSEEIRSQKDGGVPTIDNLVSFIKIIMEKTEKAVLYKKLLRRSLRIRRIAEGKVSNPRAMAVKDKNFLYVTDHVKECVVRIDLKTDRVDDIAKGSVRWPQAMVKYKNFLYLTDRTKKCVVRIDITTGRVKHIAEGRVLDPGAMVQDKNCLYIADSFKKCVVRINLNTNRIDDIAKGSVRWPQAMVKDKNFLYVADGIKKCIVRINLNTDEADDIAKGHVPDPQHIVKHEDFLYVVDRTRECVVKINSKTGEIKDIAKGSVRWHRSMVKDKSFLYVTDWTKKCVVRIDLKTDCIKDIAEGSVSDPVAMAVDRNIVYIVDSFKERVVRISIPVRTEVKKDSKKSGTVLRLRQGFGGQEKPNPDMSPENITAVEQNI